MIQTTSPKLQKYVTCQGKNKFLSKSLNSSAKHPHILLDIYILVTFCLLYLVIRIRSATWISIQELDHNSNELGNIGINRYPLHFSITTREYFTVQIIN